MSVGRGRTIRSGHVASRFAPDLSASTITLRLTVPSLLLDDQAGLSKNCFAWSRVMRLTKILDQSAHFCIRVSRVVPKGTVVLHLGVGLRGQVVLEGALILWLLGWGRRRRSRLEWHRLVWVRARWTQARRRSVCTGVW